MTTRFPKKYIKRGKVKLHSGQYSNILYDVNSMLTDFEERTKIMLAMPTEYRTYVGVATGGAILASQLCIWRNWAMVKDGELKGKIKGDYCLVDDVCTTETSIKEAIKIIRKKPKCIFVVVDRRKEKTLKIKSIYKINK